MVRAVNRAEDTAHLQEKTGSQAARNGIPVLRVPASFKRPPQVQARPLRVLSDGAVILSRAQRHPRSFQDCGGGGGVRSGLTCAAIACAEAADVDGCGRSGSRAGRGRDSRCNSSPRPFDSAQSRRRVIDATILVFGLPINVSRTVTRTVPASATTCRAAHLQHGTVFEVCPPIPNHASRNSINAQCESSAYADNGSFQHHTTAPSGRRTVHRRRDVSEPRDAPAVVVVTNRGLASRVAVRYARD